MFSFFICLWVYFVDPTCHEHLCWSCMTPWIDKVLSLTILRVHASSDLDFSRVLIQAQSRHIKTLGDLTATSHLDRYVFDA